MGEYSNIKIGDIISLLKWLERKNQSLTVARGGKHQLLVKYSFWNRPFPIPAKHIFVRPGLLADRVICMIAKEKLEIA